MGSKLEFFKGKVSYNTDTGVLTWIKNNKIAGSLANNGYLRLRSNGTEVLAHRLIWFIVFNEEPEAIDHINHNRTDNRISNLRSVTRAENQKNRTMNKNNKSGTAGVRFHKNRWASDIKVDGEKIYLGRFAKYSDAVNARKNAEVLYGFHENHGKKRSI